MSGGFDPHDKDDIALSISSLATGVATCTKKIHSSNCENQDEAYAWSSILDEANQIVCLHERTKHSLSSTVKTKARTCLKGGRCKAKPKFSIRFQSHKKEYFHDVVVEDENEESSVAEVEPSVKDTQHRASAHSMAELLEKLHKENKRSTESANSMAELLEELQQENKKSPESADWPTIVPVGNGSERCSVSTLLEELEKSNPLKWPSKLVRRSKRNERKAQVIGKRTAYHLGNRSLNNEEAPELMDSRTSSEDEDNYNNHIIDATRNIKVKSMADILQDAFSTSAVDVEQLPFATRTGIGYYGRLQQVIQRDKDRHTEFLKQLENNESRGVNVKILSRLLDAKLTVCRCLICEETMLSETRNSPRNHEELGETTERTIIFSSKIHRNVDLEVGNFMCIYPPWKEVQTREGDIIILCTYFSQIMS